MPTTIRHLALLPCAAMALIGCGRDSDGDGQADQATQGAPFRLGVEITDEGEVELQSGNGYRRAYERRIQRGLERHLGEHWEAEITIDENPRYQGGEGDAWALADRGFVERMMADSKDQDDGWQWHRAGVRVVLIGDGQERQPPVAAGPIKTYVQDAMADKMLDEDSEVTVRVYAVYRPPEVEERPTVSGWGDPVATTASADDQPIAGWGDLPPAPAPAPQPVPSAAPPPAVAAPAPQPVPVPPAGAAPTAHGPLIDYIVQPGDTLAAISIAFYGTPNHWRHIAAANPGLDPTRVVPGMILRVPMNP